MLVWVVVDRSKFQEIIFHAKITFQRQMETPSGIILTATWDRGTINERGLPTRLLTTSLLAIEEEQQLQ